MAELFMNKIWC